MWLQHKTKLKSAVSNKTMLGSRFCSKESLDSRSDQGYNVDVSWVWKLLSQQLKRSVQKLKKNLSCPKLSTS